MQFTVPFRRLSAMPMMATAGILVVVLSLAAGCSTKEAKALNTSAATSTKVVAKTWNWDSYPLMKRMRLGTLPCQLQPKSIIPINSPVLGMLKVYVTNPQTNLPAGFLWAEFEPDIFEAEKKALDEARKKLEDREKLQWEVEVPRQKMQMARELEELERKLKWLKILSENPDLASRALNFGPNSSTPLRPDSLQNTELEFDLARKTMSFLQETNMSALGIDLSSQRSDWERRKLDYDRRQAQARFRMPFDGKLTVSLPLTEGVGEYPVSSGQELGVARDLSLIRLRVPISNAAWTALAGEKLAAVIRLPNGQSLEAPFAYHKIEKFQNREESVYYFQLPEEKSETAARLIGTDVSCELWVNLDEAVRVVPKLALIMHDPASFQNRSWAGGVSSAFEGARLLVEGQTDLGVVPSKPLTVSKVSQ